MTELDTNIDILNKVRDKCLFQLKKRLNKCNFYMLITEYYYEIYGIRIEVQNIYMNEIVVRILPGSYVLVHTNILMLLNSIWCVFGYDFDPVKQTITYYVMYD